MEGIRMSRIDTVYEKLKELSQEAGVTTNDLADALGLSRANVSSDLNQLCEDGKAAKEGVRPVLYRAVASRETATEAGPTALDRLALKNPSLFPAVEQAKAAVLYPPKGMPILILGETGTGKSMFAGLIHQYAVEMGRMAENSPFVVFNCADYANNPQLLLSQLFGVKKGAYTGADSDKPGLVEKADGGILFLDEVHRLPPEGQEMFFTFMDTGAYRKLGETDAGRTAKVLIICATTENPDSALLKTFTRRIPMIIRMPNLSDRNMEERFHLISQFLREESSRLGRSISVSINSMKSFLSYHCPHNVGQLKTDIQLACAKAYAELVSNKKETIKINSIDLPAYIREGLYRETEHRQLWNKLIGINKRYCIFDSSEEQILFEEEEENIYDMIDLRVHELKSKGISDAQLEQEMAKDIEEYFSSYLRSVNSNPSFANLESIVSPEIIRVVEEIIRFSEEKLSKTFSQKVPYGMAVHIANAIERIKRHKRIVHPQLNRIRTEFPEEFTTAVDCLKIINRVLDITMPIDEAGFLAMFFVYHEGSVREPRRVKVIIIAHGVSTATSMAETANSLLGVDYAIGMNLPLDEKPQQVISTLKSRLKESALPLDILFLVDMGSLTNVGEEIEREFGIRTRTIPLVSTLHGIEATRKAMMGYSLDEIYQDTLQVNDLLNPDHSLALQAMESASPETMAIVTLCTTGEGGAGLLKSILEKHLRLGDYPMEVLPLSLAGNEGIGAKLENLQKRYRIICLVGSFQVASDLPQFGIAAVLNQSALPDIQKLVDIETTYRTIGDTLENHLKHVNGRYAMKGIKQFIDSIENRLRVKIDTSVLIGIAIHIGCMIDRLKGGGKIDHFEGKARFIEENFELYQVVKGNCETLSQKFQIHISDDEVCNLMIFFNPKNHISSIKKA
jgi:transcriptional regulator with AAA-type ATPase domain/transcriptional regulatory protein LevR